MSLVSTVVYANPNTPCWASASSGGGGTQFLSATYPQGSNGGTAPSTSFNQRELNTFSPALSGSNSTTIAGMSVSSNVITLPAGTFRVSGSAGAALDNGQSRFFDVTNSNVALLGTVAGADQRTSYSTFVGFVSPTASTQYQVETAGASLTGGDADYGQALGAGTECFLTLEITSLT